MPGKEIRRSVDQGFYYLIEYYDEEKNGVLVENNERLLGEGSLEEMQELAGEALEPVDDK